VRIHNRSTSESLQRTIPTGTAGSPLSGGSSGRPDAPAPNDAVQLSYLSGVLNSLQTGATNSAAKIDCVSQLIQQGAYNVDAIAISRKLIAASLQ
jgi:anti-sigma28 factor (negative regulator of flagellin synthesis)